jgi:hypothetical protein
VSRAIHQICDIALTVLSTLRPPRDALCDAPWRSLGTCQLPFAARPSLTQSGLSARDATMSPPILIRLAHAKNRIVVYVRYEPLLAWLGAARDGAWRPIRSIPRIHSEWHG